MSAGLLTCAGVGYAVSRKHTALGINVSMLEHKNWRHTRIWIKLRGGKGQGLKAKLAATDVGQF